MDRTQAPSPWFSSGTILTYVLIVLAALTLGFMVYSWRMGGPRRRLVYSIDAASILLAGGLPIKVTFGGEIVDDPYLVQLIIDSRSRKTIRQSDFEQSQPLLFHISAPVVATSGPLMGKGQNVPAIEAIGEQGQSAQTVQIKPTLIRRGRWFSLAFLTAGPPNVSVNNPLADVVVRRASAPVPRVPFTLMLIQAGFLIAAGGFVVHRQTWPYLVTEIVLVLGASMISGEIIRRSRIPSRQRHSAN